MSARKHQTELLEEIMAKLSELLGRLSGIDTKLDEVAAKLSEASAEIVAEIQKLKDQLGNVDIPADAEVTLATIEAKAGSVGEVAKSLADIVPGP